MSLTLQEFVAASAEPDVVSFGGAVKATGYSKVGGYVIRFTKTPDLQGDIFDPDGDYSIDDLKTIRLMYNHGLERASDPLTSLIGNRRIGTARLTRRPEGIWAEAVLDTDDPHVARVFDRVRRGELGFSSGSSERCVVKARGNGATVIKTWPLIEISLAERPVGGIHDMLAMPIKALMDRIDRVNRGAMELRIRRLLADQAQREQKARHDLRLRLLRCRIHSLSL